MTTATSCSFAPRDAGGSSEAPRLVERSPAADRLRDALGAPEGVRHRTYRMAPYESLGEDRLA